MVNTKNIVTTIVGAQIAITGTLADVTTTGNDYATVDTLPVPLFKTKVFTFTAATKDLKVTVYGDYGDGTYSTTAEAEFTVTVLGGAVQKSISSVYAGLRIRVKPDVVGQHGTLSTQVFCASN